MLVDTTSIEAKKYGCYFCTERVTHYVNRKATYECRYDKCPYFSQNDNFEQESEAIERQNRETIKKKNLKKYEVENISSEGKPYEEIGKRLKETLKKKHFTQREFAQLSGISRPTINNLSRGIRLPQEGILAIICANLDITQEWLLGKEEENDKIQ